jgi:hypothetical protein
MKRPDPVFHETLAGLAGSGTAHLEYLLYLFLQAVVLFIWWPKGTLPEVLAEADRPDTLLASVLASGFATAWYSARAGAEEFALPGQSGLIQWALGTGLPLGRILTGYLAGSLTQVLGLVALSLPLVLCGFSVSGGSFHAVTWCLVAVVFQATFLRLAAAAIHLAIGQQIVMTRVCIRGAVVATYLAGLTLLPAASHVALSRTLLDTPMAATGLAHPGVAFITWMTAGSLALLLFLRHQLSGLRIASEAVAP